MYYFFLCLQHQDQKSDMRIPYLLLLVFTLLFSQVKAQISIEDFKSEASHDEIVINKLIYSNDSWGIYKLSQYIDGYNNMFLSTGNQVYLNKSLDIILRIMKNATLSSRFRNSQFKDKYLGWVNKSHRELGNDGKEYSLYESYFWRYATSTILLVKEYSLIDKYSVKYLSIKNFCEEQVFSKWINRGKSNIYRNTTNLFAQWAHISLNMWLIDKKEKYKKVFTDFNLMYSNNLVGSGNGRYWILRLDTKLDSSVSDVSHANSEVSYLIDAYQKASVIKYESIQNLIDLLNTKILKNDNSISYYINGEGKSVDNRMLIDGFLKLGRFDKNLNSRLLKTKAIQKNTDYYCKSQYISVMLLNSKLLK